MVKVWISIDLFIRVECVPFNCRRNTELFFTLNASHLRVLTLLLVDSFSEHLTRQVDIPLAIIGD